MEGGQEGAVQRLAAVQKHLEGVGSIDAGCGAFAEDSFFSVPQGGDMQQFDHVGRGQASALSNRINIEMIDQIRSIEPRSRCLLACESLACLKWREIPTRPQSHSIPCSCIDNFVFTQAAPRPHAFASHAHST